MDPGKQRLQRTLTKVRADSSNQILTKVEDAVEGRYADNEVYGSEDDESDEHCENQHDVSNRAARSASVCGAKKNGIQLLDVASLSVEGSRGHANEDRCLMVSNERFHLFAVMDGHGGSWAGDFLMDELFKTLDEVYDDGFDHTELTKAIEELDRKFCALATLKMDMSGACLLVVLLYVDPITYLPQKIVLNTGDCRVIIRKAPESAVRGNALKGEASPSTTKTSKTFALSEDHCAGNVKERMRALQSGAYIHDNRIAGVLEPFRTIGDIDMKGPDMKNWVIATPEICQSELLVGRSTLVIATDGVWTALTNNQTMALVEKKLSATTARSSAESTVQAIVKEAQAHGSCDDITVIVVSV